MLHFLQRLLLACERKPKTLIGSELNGHQTYSDFDRIKALHTANASSIDVI